jgi:hypothetical protein
MKGGSGGWGELNHNCGGDAHGQTYILVVVQVRILVNYLSVFAVLEENVAITTFINTDAALAASFDSDSFLTRQKLH